MKKRTCKKLRFLSRIISLSLVTAMITQSALGNGTLTLASVLLQENETIVTENEYVKEMKQNLPFTENEGEPVTEPDSEEPQILFEVESLREQNEKHYRLSDSTMMAAEYAMDVHYEDESGEWVEIDNRFVYEPATESDWSAAKMVDTVCGIICIENEGEKLCQAITQNTQRNLENKL